MIEIKYKTKYDLVIYPYDTNTKLYEILNNYKNMAESIISICPEVTRIEFCEEEFKATIKIHTPNSECTIMTKGCTLKVL